MGIDQGRKKSERDVNHLAILSPAEMARADEAAISSGISGFSLMQAAGRHVAEVAMTMCAPGDSVALLCGPGNNGGDGFVAADLLEAAGRPVTVFLLAASDQLQGDAAHAFREMRSLAHPAEPDGVAKALDGVSLVVDAMFGAGLRRPLEGLPAKIVDLINRSGVPVLAVDLPSGLNGGTGQAEGAAVKADACATFFRLKPGHLLLPGRAFCGSLRCADIGIPASVLDRIRPRVFMNDPGLWGAFWHAPGLNSHKYTRGHAVVFSGPIASTGAARLAAGAALRAGAGLVTLASPPSALATNAAHLTAVMVRAVKGRAEVETLVSDPRLTACLMGPGLGTGDGSAGFGCTCSGCGWFDGLSGLSGAAVQRGKSQDRTRDLDAS